jgi:CheY-like chemotaxis protein
MANTKILVVDDEPNLSDLVRFFLEKTKRYEVRVENRPAHALSAAKEFQPDLILLDVDMPGKDGGQVAKEIKAQPGMRDIPILFLTSLISRDEAGDEPVVRGGMRFLAKPVNNTALIRTVDRILSEATIPA